MSKQIKKNAVQKRKKNLKDLGTLFIQLEVNFQGTLTISGNVSIEQNHMTV